MSRHLYGLFWCSLGLAFLCVAAHSLIITIGLLTHHIGVCVR